MYGKANSADHFRPSGLRCFTPNIVPGPDSWGAHKILDNIKLLHSTIQTDRHRCAVHVCVVLLIEKRKINGLGHRLITGVIGMHVIAAVIGG
jgi:hypothetical protein